MKEDTLLKIRAAIVIVLDAMLIAVLFLLSYIDKLVNGTLYRYGLVFSIEWAEPYWLMMKTSMALIAVAFSILTILELPYPALKKKSAHE
jgi:hypothetical protein